MDKQSERRLAENEVFFREQNSKVEAGFEHMRQVANEDGQKLELKQPDIELQFYCECSNQACCDRVALTPSAYNVIHQRDDHFVVIPGHEMPQVEKVVRQEPAYYVVEKFQTPPPDSGPAHRTDR